mgnify:FL=1
MRIIRGVSNLRRDDRNCVVTIGNFDGVHLGHQAILAEVKKASLRLDCPSLLICFEPQPKEFFDEYQAPARLTRFREKVNLLKQCGIDRLLCLKFNEITRGMKVDEFVSLLADNLAVKALYVGDDFRFGSDRSGDFSMLQRAGQEFGFQVSNFYTFTFERERVSSTRIRACLETGQFSEAETMLGDPYSIAGRVAQGRQVGRTIGVPTANIQLHRYKAPLSGVYAVEIKGLADHHLGVANVGVRPTIDGETIKPILEVHIFDFDADIYGQYVEILFRKKLREEKKYDGIEALKQAINKDINEARQFFLLDA